VDVLHAAPFAVAILCTVSHNLVQLRRRRVDFDATDNALQRLKAVMHERREITPDDIAAIAKAVHQPEAAVYGVATYYGDLGMKKRGKTRVKVCKGTACFATCNDASVGWMEEALGVKLTDRGFIKIDDSMRTSVEGIYAIGDVAGPPMLAHKGEREGIVVAEVIAGKNEHKVNYGNIPNATYCHPEVASIGLTEQQCKEQKLDYKVGHYNFSANGRARTSGETEGFVKIIRDTKYGEILGAHIIGAHATEIIHELAVARENEFTVEEIELAIHAHPTLSEAIAEAVLDSMGRALNA